MPNGTAQTAMSSEAHGATPRRRNRCSMTRTPTMMPATMHSAYARIGSPRTCHTDVVGLGIAAKFTRAPYRPAATDSSRGRTGPDTFGQFRAQRAQPVQAGPPVGGVQDAADQGAADDDAVGERGHLGRLR